MDTDLIFKRGVAYTLATGLLLGAYFGVIALISVLVHNAMPEGARVGPGHRHCRQPPPSSIPSSAASKAGSIAPFDRHRYDYRKALVEFGRGLSSETDLAALLNSIVERLPRTLLVARVAVFLRKIPAASSWPPPTACPSTRQAPVYSGRIR
jgi:two-component system NtrC family sensor kinase